MKANSLYVTGKRGATNLYAKFPPATMLPLKSGARSAGLILLSATVVPVPLHNDSGSHEQARHTQHPDYHHHEHGEGNSYEGDSSSVGFQQDHHHDHEGRKHAAPHHEGAHSHGDHSNESAHSSSH